MIRLCITALLLLAGTLRLEAQLSPPQLEEATEFTLRLARAAISGAPRNFSKALDADSTLERHLGAMTWKGLTSRQKEQLRTAVREHFLQTLAPTRASAPHEIAWSWADASSSFDSGEVILGLRFGERILKTRWTVRRGAGGWKVADVVLSDPGISLFEASLRALGPEPVLRQQRREAQRVALPRLAGLAAIGLLLLVAAPRLPKEKRVLLFLIAAAPAALFFIDGALAIQRAFSEAYTLAAGPPHPLWRDAEQSALEQEREGHPADARRLWARAIAQGAAAAPIYYEMGLEARQRGDSDGARADFQRALAERHPAPGASKELAAMDAAQGRFAVAEEEIRRYIASAGPDPDALSMLAVLSTNLGKTAQALEAIRQARALVGEGWRGAELESQVRARAGDAQGAVAALRILEGEGRLNRAALRGDPAYAQIATDPVWVNFLNEKPKKN